MYRSAVPKNSLVAVIALALLPFGAAAIGKYDARDGTECRAQVEANFQAMAREMAAAGNYRGITSNWNRWRGPAMEECEQMDRSVQAQRIEKAQARLDAAIATLRANGVIRPEEAQWLEREHAAILAFPHSAWRDAHVARFSDFVRYASPPAAAKENCPGIQAALKGARTEHDLAVDALLRHEPEWRVHDQVRQAAIAEMQWQRFLAQRAGCAP